MKNTFSLLFFLAAFSINAQTDTLSIKSPKIVCKVKYGETAGFGDYTLKFAGVSSDSRCPKKVSCVWAGEAKILVEIRKNGELVEVKTVVFGADGKSTDLFSMENLSVITYSLEPYPVEKPIQEDGKYVLNLILTEKE